MDLWFYFYLHPNSSEQDALEELSTCQIENISFLEDMETGEKSICAVANPSLFQDNWKHISSYKKIETTEINWAEEWNTFSPYFKDGVAVVPLSDFSLLSQEELTLIPGPGFGDLSHPTTRLSLKLLAKYTQNKTLIDLGCGSGILGLAALKWGADFVYALDIDPEALKHTEENALLNKVEDRLLTYLSLPIKTSPSPSLLVINMTFAEQKQAIASLPFYPSTWITSGILKEQKEKYLFWIREFGMEIEECFEEDGWIACVLTKLKFEIDSP
jgi:ribosomal protein L11 methyltransferase